MRKLALFQGCLTFLRAFLIIVMGSSGAWAADLSDAKAQGWLGEQTNGYIGLVDLQAPQEVVQLMNEVNAKRKAAYGKIAKRDGVSLGDVEKIGGAKAVEKTEPGNYIQNSAGDWQKK